MTRQQMQSGKAVLVAALIFGLGGYLLGTYEFDPIGQTKAGVAKSKSSPETEPTKTGSIPTTKIVEDDAWSPTKRSPKLDVYYPGTEDLKPDEIRVICTGSGMPMPRLKQAAASFVIELGNGDKFIFDMGTGSMHRIYALGIPLDYINKVFLTHLHADHFGDLPGFYMYGPQNNRSLPLKVWGPGGGGTRPEWGTKAAMHHMKEMFAWMNGTTAGLIDTRSLKLDVIEYDWSKVNNVIYEKDGVVIKSIPAVHLEQSASFILQWKGMTVAYSGDTLPNKWWIENTKGVDLSIHECIFTPDMAMEKWGFSAPEALNAMTTIHANPAFFGKVMAMSQPKHAVAYHFQNDADTLPMVMNEVEKYYDGPVDYAQDFMVWNVTKEGVRTRMAVPNPAAYPTPSLQEKKVAEGGDRYQTPDRVLDGFSNDFIELSNEIYDEFNKKHGTDFQFNLKK